MACATPTLMTPALRQGACPVMDLVSDGTAGIGMAQRDHVERAGGHARQQEGGFIGFRAGIGEEALLQLAGRDLRDFFGQIDDGFGGVERRGVLQAIDLRLDPATVTLGLVWPTEMVRMPPKKSRYLRPSRSQTCCMWARSATSGCW